MIPFIFTHVIPSFIFIYILNIISILILRIKKRLDIYTGSWMKSNFMLGIFIILYIVFITLFIFLFNPIIFFYNGESYYDCVYLAY